ncbi:MAG TPA: DUF262 domain-containing HNH endonuclease family protein [Candidatus Angelobacter sp.]|nr:DUF262 domain-containing HNH endonuclease family protein [Candidatus Angelobacter sp.]
MPTDISQRSDLQIEAQQLSIEDLFKSFYSVPDFQREYVWQPENVEQLLADICDELYDENNSVVPGAEYFIGSIVVYRDKDGIFQLIDGQQRTTTIFIILCIFREKLQGLDSVQKLIRETRMNQETLEEESLHRVTLQYEDSAGAIEAIATNDIEGLGHLNQSTSVRNLHGAYAEARDFLRERLADNEKEWKRFFTLFTTRVKLIRVITPSQAGALRVFETINNTGVGLTPMDLLKNLLFRKVNASEFQNIKDGWKELTEHIEKASETNPLRFLRYFVLSHFDTGTAKPLPEVELYNWISRNAEAAGLEKTPVKFLRELVNDARVYRNLSQALDPGGRPNRYLKNIQVLSGRAKQHFILLLAGQRLEPALFNRLCQVLENLFFCFIVTKEATKYFEVVFYKAAAPLRELHPGNTSGLEAFIQQWLQPEIDNRANKLQFTLENLSSAGLQKYRLRYVLAKLTQYVDEKAWSTSTNTELERYLDKRVHIEHILPDTSTPDLLNAFDKPDVYKNYSSRLGNLTLLEMSINASIGQDFFKDKSQEYQKSNFILTRTIGAPFQVGINTQPNRATAELKSWQIWNSLAIEERQRMLTQLAWRVWGVSVPLVTR